MRETAQVLTAYVVLLLLSALWRFVPIEPRPDVVALFAVYLGLTARQTLAPSALAAFFVGYLGDLLMGAPRGLLALDAIALCLLGHFVHRRLLVRGRVFTIIFSAAVAVSSGLVLMALRAFVQSPLRGLGDEVLVLLGTAGLSGLAGPLVFRAARAVDARFARTHRERVAALEGLVP